MHLSGSKVYKKKHSKPPVTVYDNVNRLVHKNPEILNILQDDSKDNADDRKHIAVFVSSERNVTRRMVYLIEEQNEELRSQNKKITELIEEANYKIRFMKMKQVIEEEYDSEETTSTIQEERTEEVSINRR
ncbi:hypothetical protein RclHR1_06140005 [Rhizophagus clarus]|uniref:Uncharacterized protein n=1 Tax=Rhizophagus clarus TaxID=94130 RepID=A0A2Z6RWM3_9GLOM|nr:hypothetical protein RclHR1_06140005 [Rhizophagus clarus]